MTKFKAALITLAPYLAVGLLQFALLYPLHRKMDLPKWDEAIYLGQADQFVHGGSLGALATSPHDPLGSPLYALLYSIPIRAFGILDGFFFMQYIVKIAVALLVLLFLTTHLKSRPPALLFTMIWVVSNVNLTEPVLVYHVALGLFLLALTFLERSPWLGLLLLILASLTRLEYLIPLVAMAAYLVIARLRGTHEKITRPQLVVASALVFLIAFVVVHVDDFHLGGKRTWFAFNQNYSRHEVEAGRFQLNPFLDSNFVIDADFPGANSLAEALAVNPRAFGKHVLRNLAMLPKQTFLFFVPYFANPGYLILLLAACLAIVAFGSSNWLLRIAAAIQNEKMLGYASLVSLVALAPILLVYPQAHHTLIMVPFLLCWPALAYTELIRGRSLALAPVLLVAAYVLFSAKPYESMSTARPVLAQINRLSAIWPKQRATLLGVGSIWYAAYLGSERAAFIEPLATVYGEKIDKGSGDLDALIQRYRPDVILINKDLTGSRNFDPMTLRALDSTDWVACPLDGDTFYFRAGQAPACSVGTSK